MTTLDSNLLSLMNQTAGWEKWSGTSTAYAEPNWSASKNKTCFIEEKGLSGAVQAVRRADETVDDPRMALYFDSNDADVLTFSMNDRFTVTALEGVETLRSRPKSLVKFVGPQGEPWITVVSL